MKTGYIIAIVALFAIAALFLFSGSSKTEVKMEGWHTFDEGKKLSEESGKEMFVFIGTDSCSICRKFKQFFATNKTATDFIKENFIPVYVDADKERPVSIFAVPTFCIGHAANLSCFNTASPQQLMDLLAKHVSEAAS